MIEQTIFANLVFNEDYARKVIPFLKKDYFQDRIHQTLFVIISKFVDQYSNFPTKQALQLEANNYVGLSDGETEKLQGFIDLLTEAPTNNEWLVDETEKFCQDKAIYNAIYQSIGILDNKDKEQDKRAIPQILADALGVSFDNHVGHDLLDDYEERYDFYHRHCAASNLSRGSNVLYITLEMAEERIAERIDANLLNVSMDELAILPRDVYQKKVQRIKSGTPGKLIIKEYPTASAGAGHFRHLLNELKIKRNFTPEIVYIDYLNICASSRLKYGANINSYTLIKSIAEELRGLAVEFNVPIVSATQTTRSGFTSSDLGLEDTSESFGLPATADFMFALISTEELQEVNQILVKQLKNRYGDPSSHRRFVIGVDRAKMKLYDVEQHAQDDVIDDKPVFDNTEFGKRVSNERKFDKNVFENFS